MNIPHPINLNKWACTLCVQSFKHQSSLSRHKKKSHNLIQMNNSKSIRTCETPGNTVVTLIDGHKKRRKTDVGESEIEKSFIPTSLPKDTKVVEFEIKKRFIPTSLPKDTKVVEFEIEKSFIPTSLPKDTKVVEAVVLSGQNLTYESNDSSISKTTSWNNDTSHSTDDTTTDDTTTDDTTTDDTTTDDTTTVHPRETVFKQLSNFLVLRRFKSHTTSFSAWAKAYQSAAKGGDPSLGEAVLKKIDSFITRSSDCFWNKCWNDSGVFEDELHDWINIQTNALSTIVNNLRYMRWYGLYLFTKGETTEFHIVLLDSVISDLQTKSSFSTINDELLTTLDPYKLVDISNNIVNGLRVQQATSLDPMIRVFYTTSQKNVPSEKCHELKCWLALAMLVCSVPLRIQCTIGLLVPSSKKTDYISKLVQHGTRFSRLINKDKVGGFSQVQGLPLDGIISAYMAFFVLHCRHKTADNDLVFQTRSGGMWSRASRDIKSYMKGTIGIDPNDIDSSGRFVHRTRMIGLAVFAASTDFDEVALNEYAILLRHKLDTVKRYYLPFLAQHQAKRAISRISQMRGATMTLDLPQDDVMLRGRRLQLLPLLSPSDSVTSCVQQEMTGLEQGKNIIPVFERKTIGTQTICPDASGLNEVALADDHEHVPGSTPPICRKCDIQMNVYGPHGQSRDKCFARFYFACSKCDKPGVNKAMRATPDSIYFALGSVPTTSMSSRPRNLQAIIEYIQHESNLNVRVKMESCFPRR